MRPKLFPQLLISSSSTRNSSGIRWAVIAVVVATVAWRLADGPPAESSHVDTGMESMLFTLQAPVHFAVSAQEEDKTAFREDEAGFSAYYRVPKRSDSNDRYGGLPRLNVAAITEALLDAPKDTNWARAGFGSPQHMGSNFGIVELPMYPVVGFGKLVEPRKVMVYFDDRGWVVAYLPAREPAAGIWRYDVIGSNPSDGSEITEHLEQNLLVLAINEVLNAGKTHNPELSIITHDDVGYYDWQNAECNAFLLFNNVAKAGTSQPANFVIPPAIADVQASTAVLITSRYSIGGDPVSASVALGRETVVTADETTLLRVAKFDIERPTDDNDDRQTSLHKMSVTVSGNDTATGVVMLLYNKPER